MSSPQPARSTPSAASDHTLLHHLGLPFYYRHTPGPLVRRGIFWLAFLGIIALVLFNIVLMPFDQDSFAHHLRFSLFGRRMGFASFERAAVSMFNQFYIIAFLLSGVLAPLYACFSLTNERVLGTMEFLRLAPLSSTGIVMGKLFGSTYIIHLISCVLLLLAMVLGFLCGFAPEAVLYAIACAIFHSIAMITLGGFLATQIKAFRGFGAVALLIVIGMGAQIMPLECVRYGPEGGFVSLLSPWSTLDLLFWRMSYQGKYTSNLTLFHSTTLAFVYALAAQVVVIGCLIHAASRKLDSSENTALKRWEYLLLWGVALLAALGIVMNYDSKMPAGSLRFWESGCATLILTGLPICLMALLDHPFRRERVLTYACEYLAGRESAPSPTRANHAYFCVLFTALNIGAIAGFLYAMGPFQGESAIIAMIFGLVLFIVLGAALLLEASALRFPSFLGQAITAVICISIFFAVSIAPLIHLESVYSEWTRCLWNSEAYFRYQTSKSPQAWNPSDLYQAMRRNPEWAEMLDDMKDLQSTARIRQEYYDRPLAVMWRYSPKALVFYPLVLALALLVIVRFRTRVYKRLFDEARLAVQPPPPSMSK